MKCLTCTDLHFTQVGDQFYCRIIPADFFQRYLEVWDALYVLGRLRQEVEPPPGVPALDFTGIKMIGLPDFHGPIEYVRHARQIRTITLHALSLTDSVLLRVPGIVGIVVSKLLRNESRPFGAEVCGDPQEAFARGTMRHPLRPFFRWYYTRALRWECHEADATSYVTAATLQRKYPPNPDRFSTSYSNVQIPESELLDRPREKFPQNKRFRLVMVATFSQMYKGHDVLLRALARLSAEIDWEMVFIGGGKFRPDIEQLAQTLGLADRTIFRGELPAGEAIRSELDRADLFVMPSRTEGLPRAMIEAMARGLPCIGSKVGGIPELLEPTELVIPNDVTALAQKLTEILSDRERLVRLSRRNLQVAADYCVEVLAPRRQAFYEHLRTATETWLKKQNREPVPQPQTVVSGRS